MFHVDLQRGLLRSVFILLAFVVVIQDIAAQTIHSKEKRQIDTLSHNSNISPIVDSSGVTIKGLSMASSHSKRIFPSPDEFITVDSEPLPLEKIADLVEYPQTAIDMKLEGKVTISALIDTNGQVLEVIVNKSKFSILDLSVSNAVKQTRFTPAMQNGKPVLYWYVFPIIFKLGDQTK